MGEVRGCRCTSSHHDRTSVLKIHDIRLNVYTLALRDSGHNFLHKILWLLPKLIQLYCVLREELSLHLLM